MLHPDRQAGAEIEVTPEMIEAGMEAYAGHYADLLPSSSLPDVEPVRREMVADVFRAMVFAQRK